MNKHGFEYEPPKARIFRFNNNDRILTESGTVEPAPEPTPYYAAAALNDLFGGINTTKE